MDAVAVFETTDMLELERAKSILDQYQIVWFVKNEHSQNTLSSLGMIAGYDPLAGAYRIMVSEKDADKALEALGSIFPEFNEEENEQQPDNERESELPEESEFREDDKEARSPEAKEQRADMVKLMMLSMYSFFITPALFTIPYYIRLKGKYVLPKLFSSVILGLTITAGLLVIILRNNNDRDSMITASLISFVLLSTIKSISLHSGKRTLPAILFLIPLVLLAVLLFTGKIELFF